MERATLRHAAYQMPFFVVARAVATIAAALVQNISGALIVVIQFIHKMKKLISNYILVFSLFYIAKIVM